MNKKYFFKTKAYNTPGGLEDKRTIAERADFFASNAHTLGASYQSLLDCIKRGWRNNILFVKYEDLCYSTANVMKTIYEFLGLEPYLHDFEGIEQVTEEDDRFHDYVGLHDIRNSLEQAPIRNRLGEYCKKFDNQSF